MYIDAYSRTLVGGAVPVSHCPICQILRSKFKNFPYSSIEMVNLIIIIIIIIIIVNLV